MTNIIKEMANEVTELTNESIKTFQIAMVDCFPSVSYKIIEIDGKTYKVKMEIEMEEI